MIERNHYRGCGGKEHNGRVYQYISARWRYQCQICCVYVVTIRMSSECVDV